jgi:hypothetical protein
MPEMDVLSICCGGANPCLLITPPKLVATLVRPWPGSIQAYPRLENWEPLGRSLAAVAVDNYENCPRLWAGGPDLSFICRSIPVVARTRQEPWVSYWVYLNCCQLSFA